MLDSMGLTSNAARQPCLCLAVTRSAAEVDGLFAAASATYATGTSVWIIHPKQSGRYPADLNQNDVRSLGHGWVDCKVCAIDQDWSALKFARRKADQALPPCSMKPSMKRAAQP